MQEKLNSVLEQDPALDLSNVALPKGEPEKSPFLKKITMALGLLSALGLSSCNGLELDGESPIARGLGLPANEDDYGSRGTISLESIYRSTSVSPSGSSPVLSPSYSGGNSQRYSSSTAYGYHGSAPTIEVLGTPIRRGDLHVPFQGLRERNRLYGINPNSSDRRSSGVEIIDGELNIFEKAYDRASRRVGDYIDLFTSGERLTEWAVRRGMRKLISECREGYERELEMENDPFIWQERQDYYLSRAFPSIPSRTHYRLSLPSLSDIRRGEPNIGVGIETPLGKKSAIEFTADMAEGGNYDLNLSFVAVF